MSAAERHTSRPFTVAICAACGDDPDSTLMPRLRETIRNCPHGVLVVTACMLGEFTCATRRFATGQVLILQPCTVERVPTASVQWIGPVRTDSDVQTVCGWISAGVWHPSTLPVPLRADLALTRPSAWN